MGTIQMNTEKKNPAEAEPYESDRRGDYSDELEYLYHNYQLDKEIPWVRYIALYLVTAIAVACFIYIAVRYCPRRLNNPYREPEIIDKLGFFDNTSELLPELKALQEKTGAYFAIASIPGEEYRLPDDGYTIRQLDVYHNLFDDEDHVLIFVSIVDNVVHNDLVYGKNTVNIVRDVPIEKTISSKTRGPQTLPGAILDSLRELNPSFMKLQSQFYVFAAAAVLGILFIPWHIYRYIIKRR